MRQKEFLIDRESFRSLESMAEISQGTERETFGQEG